MKTNLLKKIIFELAIIIGILFAMTIKSNAASLSISTSKSSVSPGESFTVTVSVSGGAGYVLDVLQYLLLGLLLIIQLKMMNKNQHQKQ